MGVGVPPRRPASVLHLQRTSEEPIPTGFSAATTLLPGQQAIRLIFPASLGCQSHGESLVDLYLKHLLFAEGLDFSREKLYLSDIPTFFSPRTTNRQPTARRRAIVFFFLLKARFAFALCRSL